MDKYLGLISEEEITKTASYYKISERVSDWPKDVLDHFYREFPSLINYDAQIIFREKDESKGYGLGVIKISGLGIPVIIKGFRMAPLDVCLVNGKVLPFTKESLAALITQKSAFSQLKPMDENEAFTSNFDPALGAAAGDGIINYEPSGGYEKTSSIDIFKKLSGKITKVKKAKIMNEAKKYKDKEHVKCALTKIANMSTTDELVDANQKLSENIDRDIWYIYKKGQYRYTGIFGNSKVDDPIIVEDMEAGSLNNIEHIKTAAGPEISQNTSVIEEIDVASVPSAGDYGILKFANDESTSPFMVDNIRFTDKSFVIHGHDGFTPRNFYPIRGITSCVEHEVDKYGTYIPDEGVKFVKIELTKKGEKRIFGSNYNTVERINKLAYRMRGPVLEKYADKHAPQNNWGIHDITWSLIATGASEKDITKVAKLKVGEEYAIQTQLRLPTPLENVTELINDEINKRGELDNTIDPDLIRIAAYLPDAQSVDSVLGLNFLSKININEFIDLLPTYEEVTSGLARLLIGIRMGLEKLPEEPIKQAMVELMKVIYFLRGVSNLRKV